MSRLGRDSKATGRQTFFRGPGGNRTHDLRIKSPLLYRLSYRPAAERVVAHRPPSSLFWRPIVPDTARLDARTEILTGVCHERGVGSGSGTARIPRGRAATSHGRAITFQARMTAARGTPRFDSTVTVLYETKDPRISAIGVLPTLMCHLRGRGCEISSYENIGLEIFQRRPNSDLLVIQASRGSSFVTRLTTPSPSGSRSQRSPSIVDTSVTNWRG